VALYAEIHSFYLIACNSKSFIDISETKTCSCHAQTGAKATSSFQQHGKAWYMGVLHVCFPGFRSFFSATKTMVRVFIGSSFELWIHLGHFFLHQRWLKKTNHYSLSRLNSKSRRFRGLFSASRFGFHSLFDLRQFK